MIGKIYEDEDFYWGKVDKRSHWTCIFKVVWNFAGCFFKTLTAGSRSKARARAILCRWPDEVKAKPCACWEPKPLASWQKLVISTESVIALVSKAISQGNQVEPVSWRFFPREPVATAHVWKIISGHNELPSKMWHLWHRFRSRKSPSFSTPEATLQWSQQPTQPGGAIRPIHGINSGCLEIYLKPNLGSCLNLCMSCRGMTPGDVLLNKSAGKHDENIMKHVLSLIILWKNSQSLPDPIEIHGFFAPSDSHISGGQVPLLRCFHEKVWGSAAPIPAVVSTKLDSSVEHLPQKRCVQTLQRDSEL